MFARSTLRNQLEQQLEELEASAATAAAQDIERAALEEKQALHLAALAEKAAKENGGFFSFMSSGVASVEPPKKQNEFFKKERKEMNEQVPIIESLSGVAFFQVAIIIFYFFHLFVNIFADCSV